MLRYNLASLRAAWSLLGIAALVTPAQQSTFRGGVELLTIDVQITPSKDAPLRAFTAADFDVTVSGKTRPVASAALLHRDEGSIARNPPRLGTADAEACIFGFHRKVDRPTAHYRLGIQPMDTDRATKKVTVTLADPLFATRWLAWRLPVRQE